MLLLHSRQWKHLQMEVDQVFLLFAKAESERLARSTSVRPDPSLAYIFPLLESLDVTTIHPSECQIGQLTQKRDPKNPFKHIFRSGCPKLHFYSLPYMGKWAITKRGRTNPKVVVAAALITLQRQKKSPPLCHQLRPSF